MIDYEAYCNGWLANAKTTAKALKIKRRVFNKFGRLYVEIFLIIQTLAKFDLKFAVVYIS